MRQHASAAASWGAAALAPALDLLKLGQQLAPVLGEVGGDGLALRLQAQAGPALAFGADVEIRHELPRLPSAHAHSPIAALRGRPPRRPFSRAAAVLAGERACPPTVPKRAAIQRREPSTPSNNAGT